MSQDQNLLLTVPEAAATLGVGRATFYRLITSGEIQVVRVRGCVRVPRNTLQEWVSKNSRNWNRTEDQNAVAA